MPFALLSLRAERRALAVFIGVALFAAAVALAAAPPAARAAEHAVQIGDGTFGPATLTVTVGATVTWTNGDDSPHTVTAEDGSFDSGNVDEGGIFSQTFTTPGTYPYRCDYHSDMTATVVVEAAATAPTAAAAAPSASVAPATDGQPDTALPVPANAELPIAPLLIGLGLVALAFGLVPPRTREASTVRARGWRR